MIYIMSYGDQEKKKKHTLVLLFLLISVGNNARSLRIRSLSSSSGTLLEGFDLLLAITRELNQQCLFHSVTKQERYIESGKIVCVCFLFFFFLGKFISGVGTYQTRILVVEAEDPSVPYLLDNMDPSIICAFSCKYVYLELGLIG